MPIHMHAIIIRKQEINTRTLGDNDNIVLMCQLVQPPDCGVKV